MIHGLHDLRYLSQSLHRTVKPLLFHANDTRELDEIITLSRSQWMLFEERDNAAPKILGWPHIVSIEVLPMIVVPTVHVDLTAFEELLQFVQYMHAPFSLDDRKGRLDLPADPVRPVAKDRNTKATFTVDEADDPLLDPWPFLLIVRTGRVLTAHDGTLSRTTDMNEYRRILGCSSI
jgi:hypothetical protein